MSEQDELQRVIEDVMIEHGPDGHCDGADKIAEAVRAYYGWRPIETAKRGDTVLVYYPEQNKGTGKNELRPMYAVATIPVTTHRKPTLWKPLFD